MFIFCFRKGFYRRKVVETKNYASKAFTNPVKIGVGGGLMVTSANQDSEYGIYPGYGRNICFSLPEERKKPR